MSNSQWSGVYSAVTTKFTGAGQLDRALMEKHFEFQIESGVDALVVLGSLGENGTLSLGEKQEVIQLAVRVSKRRVPVLSGVAETTTAGACRFVEQAGANGADGFMVLPGMQYVSDRRETMHHLRSVAAASPRPIMLYNNPIAYRVDITPDMFAELAFLADGVENLPHQVFVG